MPPGGVAEVSPGQRCLTVVDPPVACGGNVINGSACGPDGQVWVGVDYLGWWVRGSRVPPLLTTNPAGTALADAGLLGTAGTTVRFGGGVVNDDFRSGLRARIGCWCDDDRTFGLEASFFLLEGQGQGGRVGTANGDTIAGRPFINALTGAPASELVAFPGVLDGDATADVGSSNLYGANAVLRCNLCCCNCNPCQEKCYRIDVVAGYQFLAFDDSVRVREQLSLLDPFLPGTLIALRDDFQARNSFHGGVIGLDAECYWGPWLLGARPRIAVGYSANQVTINGSTTVSAPGADAVTQTGGLLAQVSNIGRHRFGDVAFVPMVDVVAGVEPIVGVRFLLGYTFLYWSRVARAGEQIDPVVNPNFLPPATGGIQEPLRPAFPEKASGLWAQGVSVGLELRY